MELRTAIRNRRSIRSFKSEPVSKDILEKLLEDSLWAPSASNTQPWHFEIFGGTVIAEAKKRITEKVKSEWDSSTRTFRNINPDITPPRLFDPYLGRSMTLRAHIDNHQFPVGVEELDKKRRAYLLYAAGFYGAPNAILLCTERELCPKALLDVGIMAQTIAMSALGYDLGTCISSMIVFWPDIFRNLLELPASRAIALAIAIGYPESQSIVNTFERSREPLHRFAHWHGI